LPKYIPSFTSWWNGAITEPADLAEKLQTAATAMKRRGQTLTEAHADLYQYLFDQSASERRRLIREAEQRRLQRVA
jgi:hypothetical protein